MRGNISKFTNKSENQHHLEVCIKINSHLIHKYNLTPHREWIVFYDHEDNITSISYEVTREQKERKERYKCPDILWQDKYGLWILEVDGKVHYDKSEKTEKRNKLYQNNNINYMVLDIYEFLPNKKNVTNKPIPKIIDELDKKIIEIRNV